MLKSQKTCLEKGITSVGDMGVYGKSFYHALQSLSRSRELKLRVNMACYEMTLVKGEIACQKQIFEQGHVRRAETIRIPALATLLYVDWLPQVNGPPGALLSSVVDHESAIIVNT